MKLNLKFRKYDGDPLPQPRRYRKLGAFIFLLLSRYQSCGTYSEQGCKCYIDTLCNSSSCTSLSSWNYDSVSTLPFWFSLHSSSLLKWWLGKWSQYSSFHRWFLRFFRGSSLILRVACVKLLLPGLLMRLSIKNWWHLHGAKIVLWSVAWYECLYSTSYPIYYDNRSVISIATNLVFQERTKHIEVVDCHVTRLEYTPKKIVLPYIPSKEQVDDVFTKAQTIPQFHYLSKLSIFYPPWVWWGVEIYAQLYMSYIFFL